MTLPFRQATAQDLRRDPPVPIPNPTEALPTEAPSVFERECLNNLSPNDPEFVRRTSMRWKRKTAAVLRHREMLVGTGGPPQGLLELPVPGGGGAPWGGAPHEPLVCTRFEWRTHPSQQPAFYRRVSAPQGPCYLVEATMPPTHCPQRLRGSERHDLRKPRRRFSASEATGKSRDGRRRKTSHQPSRRKSSGRCVDERVADAFHRFLRVGGRRKVSSPSSSSSSSSRKPQNTYDRMCGVGGADHLTAHTTFYRLGQRLRRSFRGHSSDVDDASSDSGLSSLSSSSHLSALSSPYSSFRSSASSCSFSSSFSTSSTISASSSSASFPASTSCHSDLSSSASCHSNMSALSSTSSSALSSSSSSPRLGFHDIFVGEQEIAEQFAIMFPSEPRPEWHRHLRQVLHKAGQKIFKKPEPHDTHIPEDLRYQLKQIYVY